MILKSFRFFWKYLGT